MVMDMTDTDPQVWQRWSGAKQLALVAAFEDSVTGTRVKEFCQQLSRRVGKQCQILEHVWLLNTLRFPELQEIAAEEAATADLVIICFHEGEGLPDEVRSWIDLWVQQKGTHKAVLLALLDAAREGSPGPIQAYLQEVARKGDMEFLVEPRAVLGARGQGE